MYNPSKPNITALSSNNTNKRSLTALIIILIIRILPISLILGKPKNTDYQANNTDKSENTDYHANNTDKPNKTDYEANTHEEPGCSEDWCCVRAIR